MRFRRSESEQGREIPQILLQTLTQLDQDAIILAPGEVTIFATEGIDKLGLHRDGRLQSPELIALIRVVRREGHAQTGKIELPRGPIGEGVRDLTVKVLPLGQDDLILILISD